MGPSPSRPFSLPFPTIGGQAMSPLGVHEAELRRRRQQRGAADRELARAAHDVHDAQRWPRSRAPSAVQRAELAVPVGLRSISTRSDALEILQPQQLQRPVPIQLPRARGRSRHVAPASTEQHRFELGVHHLPGAFPSHADFPRAGVGPKRRLPPRTASWRSGAAAAKRLQPEQLTNLCHAQAFRHAPRRHTSKRRWRRAASLHRWIPRRRALGPDGQVCSSASESALEWQDRRSSGSGIPESSLGFLP